MGGSLRGLKRLEGFRGDVLPVDDPQADNLIEELLALIFREGYLDWFVIARCSCIARGVVRSRRPSVRRMALLFTSDLLLR